MHMSDTMKEETQKTQITPSLGSFYFQASLSGFNYSLSGKAMLRAACTGTPAWEHPRSQEQGPASLRAFPHY